MGGSDLTLTLMSGGDSGREMSGTDSGSDCGSGTGSSRRLC